jgi:hypothetical protein
MFTFHPFPRLPLELRRSIWELSIEPREVAVGRELSRCSRTPPPPVLLAECEGELPLIQRLVIKSQDAETFYRNYGYNLSRAKALETVTIFYIRLDAR